MAKLAFLLAAIALVVSLAVFAQFVPALHRRTLRQRLRPEVAVQRAMLLQQHELGEWRRLGWTRVASDQQELGQALARLGGSEVVPKDPEEPDEPIDEAVEDAAALIDDTVSQIENLTRTFEEAAERATAFTNWTPHAFALLDSDSTVLATVDPEGILESASVRGAVGEVSERRRLSGAVIEDYDHIYQTTVTPVEVETGQLVGFVIALEHLDADAVGSAVAEVDLNIVFFRDDGLIYSSNLEQDDHRRAAERYISRIVQASEESMALEREGEVGFDEKAVNLLAMAGGQLPGPSGNGEDSAIHFVVFLDGGELSENLLAMVRNNWVALPASNRIWITVAFGGLLLLLGIALFEIEGHRYRRAIGVLEYLVAKQTADGDDGGEDAESDESNGSSGDSPVVLTMETEAVPDDAVASDEATLFEKYLELRTQLGHSNEGKTLDRFSKQLRRSEREVMRRFECDGVRFKVGQLHGKVVVMAVPVYKESVP